MPGAWSEHIVCGVRPACRCRASGRAGRLPPDNARYRRVERDYPGAPARVTIHYGADGYEQQVTSSQTVRQTVHRIELGPAVYTRVVTETANSTTAAPSEVGYQLRDRLGSTIAIADRWGHYNSTPCGAPVK